MFPKSKEKPFLTHKPAESLAEKKGQEKNYVTRKWKNVIYVVIRVLGCTSVNVKNASCVAVFKLQGSFPN